MGFIRCVYGNPVILFDSGIIILFFIIFIQIFCFKKKLFFNYILISPYLLVLILYPYYKDSILSLFLGFVLGIISYAALTAYFFKQPVTSKIFVQLILCFLIVLVQVLWKEKIN